MLNLGLGVDRTLVLAAIVLTAILFLPAADDPLNIIKMVALAICALALLATAAVRAVRARVLHVPVGPAALAGIALLAAFVAAALRAPDTTTAVLGAYGRNSGLLTYGSALVLFLAALRAFDRRTAPAIVWTLTATGAVVASYGLLQYAGVDPIAWTNPFNPIIATLGNPNFAAAYLGICAPAAAWGAVQQRTSIPWRVASGVIALLCLAASILSEASQGPLAAGAGLSVLVAAWLLDRPKKVRVAGLSALGTSVVAAAAAVVAGVAGLLPLGLADIGTRARQFYWEAAFTMWRENPLLGVGLDMYGGHWLAARSLEAVRVLGENFTDSAHSVPLHLLATGGLLLAGTYLALVLVVGLALLSGLRELKGHDRLVLGALGGSWLAYQVQSLVSIDQVPLTVTHYVLAAGVVVAAGRIRVRELRLPGAAPANRAGGHAGRRPQPVDHVLTALVLIMMTALLWGLVTPLRSSIAAHTGDRHLAGGDARGALQAYSKAAQLVPGEGVYWLRQGELFRQAERPEFALRSLQRALKEDRYNVVAARTAAAAAAQTGEVALARTLHERALELDPYGEKTLVAAGEFFLDAEEPERGLQILERGVGHLPDSAALWTLVGRARQALGDEQAALAAYRRALALDPEQPVARAESQRLAAAASES